MKEEEAEVERGTAAPTWTSPLPPEKRLPTKRQGVIWTLSSDTIRE